MRRANTFQHHLSDDILVFDIVGASGMDAGLREHFLKSVQDVIHLLAGV
jgi:hypothetical protein